MNHSENMNSHIHRDPEYQKQLAKYLFQCILSEGSKILIFSILFFTWGLFPEFLTALILLILLRTNGGGIHCKHYSSCFLLSFSMLFGNIQLAHQVILPAPVMIALSLACMVPGYRMVPVPSTNRPEPSRTVVLKSKRNTLLILLALSILICRFPDQLFIRIGFWAIMLHITQLFIAEMLRRKGGKTWT
ncbi:MAG: accessory gene regulator B family protein [Lachnospiraceae bacterium]|nr:accessory gene regulator B family protein [Lachnospiraceae bacterium]